jgi:large subunit ribosomal protein L35
MPKLKTNKGAAKRFKETGTGRYKHRRAARNHILTKKTTQRKRHLRPTALVNPSDQKAIERMIKG